MRLTIEGKPGEIKKLFDAIGGSKEQFDRGLSWQDAFSSRLDGLELKHDRDIETVRALIQQVQSHNDLKVKKMYRHHAKDLNG